MLYFCHSTGLNIDPCFNKPKNENSHKKNRNSFYRISRFLWRISDSNRPPLACQASALAKWANPPIVGRKYNIYLQHKANFEKKYLASLNIFNFTSNSVQWHYKTQTVLYSRQSKIKSQPLNLGIMRAILFQVICWIDWRMNSII